jgi:acyl-coenzyme A thioesterase PaaI-like protein
VSDGFSGAESERFSGQQLDDGWLSWNITDQRRFNALLEPLSVRAEPEVTPGMPRGRLRMHPAIQHSNLGDAVHGAVTLGLIDISLFAVPIQHGLLGDGFSVTLDLNTQFIGAGRLGEPLDCVTEVVRSTRRLLFMRGLVVQGPDDSHIVASFTGTVRKPSPRS